MPRPKRLDLVVHDLYKYKSRAPNRQPHPVRLCPGYRRGNVFVYRSVYWHDHDNHDVMPSVIVSVTASQLKSKLLSVDVVKKTFGSILTFLYFDSTTKIQKK